MAQSFLHVTPRRLLLVAFLCANKYAAGTMNTVSTTDTANPPMIARASGAYASLPVPSFMAIGSKPITVANDVIRIGRNWLSAGR